MRPVSTVVTLMALLLAWTSAVADDPTADDELAALAQSIQQYLKGRNESSIRVGPFVCKKDLKVSHGPGLCQKLGQELARLGVKVDGTAALAAEGEYEDKDDNKSKRVYIHLTCYMVDRKGKEGRLYKFQRGIFGVPALIEFLASPAIVLDPAASPKEREVSLIAQADKQADDGGVPLAVLAGSRVFADFKKLYGIELLVKKGATYAPVMPEVKAQQIYVPLQRDNVFAIRIVNQSRHDAAATVVIDGLNVFTFSDFLKPMGKDSPPAAPRWLVSKGKETQISGWPIRNGLSHEFTVTDYAKSAIAEVGGSTSKVGVLTVIFAAAWPKGGTPPEDETAKGSTARNAFAVGKGAPIDTPFQTREMAFGNTRAAISIRYQRE